MTTTIRKCVKSRLLSQQWCALQSELERQISSGEEYENKELPLSVLPGRSCIDDEIDDDLDLITKQCKWLQEQEPNVIASVCDTNLSYENAIFDQAANTCTKFVAINSNICHHVKKFSCSS